jgi:isoquinoline 1-oxidoreductase beta subunit
VSIGDKSEPRVHKVWCALDCGVAVNPDIVRAQVEGGIGYIRGALLGEITLMPPRGRSLPTCSTGGRG